MNAHIRKEPKPKHCRLKSLISIAAEVLNKTLASQIQTQTKSITHCDHVGFIGKSRLVQDIRQSYKKSDNEFNAKSHMIFSKLPAK